MPKNKVNTATAASTASANAVTFAFQSAGYSTLAGVYGASSAANVYPISSSAMSGTPSRSLYSVDFSANAISIHDSTTATYDSELVYTTFKATVTVPAREQYVIDFSFTGTATKYGDSDSSNTARVGIEFLDFGEDAFPVITVQGAGNTSSSYTKFVETAVFVGDTCSQTYDNTVTCKNDTDTDNTYTFRFGFRVSKSATKQLKNRFTAGLSMSATVSQVDLLPIGLPQSVTQVFNGVDMLSPVDSAITGKSWYYADRMDLSCATGAVRDVGTYTVTASLSGYAVSEGVEWISDVTTGATTTADQTFTLTITQKPVSYTLSKKVTNDVYGDTDAGLVEAVYTGIDASDAGTKLGPDLEIYYKSADNYGYGTGAGDDSGRGLGSITPPTLAGKYTASAIDKNAATSNYLMSGTPYNFEIRPKGITAVSAPAQSVKTYNGAIQDFLLNNSYDATTMEMKRDGGLTPDASGKYADGVIWDSANTKISVTNAGEYKFEFELKDKRNNCWLPYPAAGGTYDTASKPVTLTIEKYDLSTQIQPDPVKTTGNTAGTTTWALGEAGQIVLQVTPQGTDRVSLYLDYVETTYTNNPYRIGVTDSTLTLDVSQLTVTGSYTLRARIMLSTESGYVAANENYKINTSDNYYKFNFTVGAGKANVALNWTYTTGGIPAPLFDATGAQAKLIYDEGITYVIDATVDATTTYASIDRTTARNNYTNGIYTFRQDGAPSDMKSAGVYITRIAVVVDAAHAFDAAHSFGTNGNKEGWVEIQWEIAPKELDFTNSEWQYSTDYDKSNASAEATWTKFSKPAQVEVSALYIYNVRLDPDYIKSIGLDPDKDISVRYTDDEYSAKGTHVTTAEVTISNSNYILPNNVSPYRFTFSWEITSKQIEFDGWEDEGGQVTLTDGRIFGVPVLKAKDGGDYTKYLTYTFTDKMTGTQYICSADPVTGKTDYTALLPALLSASDTNQLEFDVNAAVSTAHAGDYILKGAMPATVKFGASKSPVKVEITGTGTQYGEVEFSISATYEDNGTEVAFDGTLYTVTVSKDGTVLGTFTGGEAEKIKECLTSQGVYDIELKITDVAANRRYALDTTSYTFTVAQKEISVPVTDGIVFNGGYISVAEYFDATLKGYIADGIVKIAGGSSFRDAGDYIAYLEITDDNYTWEKGAAIAPAKYQKLTAQVSADGTKLDLPWTIGKAQLSSESWNLSGKNGATLNALAAWQDKINAGEVEVGLDYRYYDNGKNLLETVEFKGGKTFFVDAYLTGADANNFEFINGTGTDKFATEKVEYKVPQSGVMAAAGTAVNFVKSNWLWFVIALAILLFLIILIVIIAKRRKNKEEREAKKEAKKEAKEEEKRRREEERETAKAKREAELELQRAKQEAELAKIKAQAGIGAGAAGLAMAMQQPAQAQQQMPQQQPYQAPAQPQQQMPQQPYPQMQAMPQQMMQYPYPPMPQPAPYYSQINEERLRSLEDKVARDAEERARRAEENALRAAEERMRAAEERALRAEYGTGRSSYGYNESRNIPDGITMDVLGALVVSALKNMAAGNAGIAAPATKEIPQNLEESKPVSVAYPPDAVVTTTTTVDTTKNVKPALRSDDDRMFDIDGFYDTFEENK